MIQQLFSDIATPQYTDGPENKGKNPQQSQGLSLSLLVPTDKDMSKIPIPAEVWKPVQGYESLYQISNLGRVKSCGHWMGNRRQTKPKIRKTSITNCGYETIVLARSKEHRTVSIHRLVAFHFVPNYSIKPCVNHKNGIKTDNRAINLEWVTHSENTQHGIKNGLIAKNGYRHTPVIKLDINGNFLARYTRMSAAGFKNTSHIVGVCRGRRKTAYGFKWKYE